MQYPSTTKILAGLAATAITLSLLPTGFAAFSDVSGSTQYQAAIRDLEAKGVIEGYTDGTFQPKNGIKRGEFLKILLESRGEVTGDLNNCFPDVKDEWFAKYVCLAKSEGIVSGFPSGRFEPGELIDFVQASKMLTLAYKQTVDQGGEWYECYARALESSKAIPTTIATLDAPLKRGEMAEMMWRLSEDKTDQPSKGYLNVKYPDMKINLASSEPQLAKSCTDLKAFTESASSGYGGGIMYEKAMNGVGAPMAMDAVANQSARESDYFSMTNVQVEGVDEGDRVKTDGSYLYVVSRRDSKVRIIDIRNPKNMKVVSTLSFDLFIPNDIYIDGTTLAVTGQVSQNFNSPMPMMEDSASAKMMIWPPVWYVQKTSVKLYDTTNKSAPNPTRTVSFEGNAVSSRLIDGKMLLVLNTGTRWYGPYAQNKQAVSDALVPVYDDTVGAIKDKPVANCDQVTILPRVPRPQYLTVATIPLHGTAAVGRTVILGDGQQIYASLRNLYIASTDYVYHWRGSNGTNEEKTNIYRFQYESNGTKFAAQGSVPGHLLNQFSMDENGDSFRVATTISPQWNLGSTSDFEGTPVMTKSTNNLYVLNEDLDTVGSVTDIAPGESIYSVRFMGNRAYMVTFKQVDPLFVIDLSSPRSPRILGKLKIPGYSNYLHPVDENHILGFGKEVDESIDADKVHSDDAVYYTAILGMKVALFDVTDVEHPKEIHKEVIGGRGTDSPLLSDHKALLFDKEKGLLAFPVTVYEKRLSPKTNEWDADTMPVFQGAYVYSFNVNSGFSLKGKITHHAGDDFLKSGEQWYDTTGLDIDRIVRVGTELFTVSESKLKASDLATLKEEGAIDLAKDPPEGSGGYPRPMSL